MQFTTSHAGSGSPAHAAGQLMMIDRRSAGVLLHPTSLPGAMGIGDMGPSADLFLDWAAAAGLSIWQVLPLGPTGYGNSPYGCLSSFAGNPLLISPQELIREGFLASSELPPRTDGDDSHIAFHSVIGWKDELLRRSWKHFQKQGSDDARHDLDTFNGDPAQAGWLDEWALFLALKKRFNGSRWSEWEPRFAARESAAVAAARIEMTEEIAFQKYVQFLFFRQWERVRREAHQRNIRILGDVPIYVAFDSADVWADAELFLLDENREPLAVAGVPPDYFSPTGQLWGNPLYRWDRMERSGFAWWIARLRANLRFADILRLDHFRGFAAHWEVPARETLASGGHWSKGPGLNFFKAVKGALGDLPLVAEDLGLITPDVDELREAIGLPGMRVLQFGFSDLDNVHLPHRFTPDLVVYTGTHDNDTTVSWFARASPEERQMVKDYVGSECDADIEWQMIRLALNSVARLAIVPMQDALGLDGSSRMNTPGQAADNWSWRLRAEQLDAASAERLRRLVEISGRI
jgi:4-alpha-glucanotransferase